MNMKTMLGAGLLLAAAPAFAENWDFVLVNKTGKTIELVEVARAGSGEWKKDKREEDRGPGTIEPGDDYTVHFDKDGATCQYDIRMTFKGDDTPVIWTGFDACKFAFGDFALANGTPTVKGS